MSGPPPPPPPPPHGEAPKTTAGGGLPPGKYDIFVIPEHSAGSGFLYLPSLRPNINSFIAGFASAMALIALGQSMAPAFQVWWANFQGMGNMGMMMLTIAVGLGAWSLGRQQNDGGGGPGTGGSGPTGGSGSHSGTGFGGASHGSAPGSAPPPPPNHGGPPPTSPPPPPQPDPPPQNEKPKSSWQQRAPPQTGTTGTETPKGAWERAREETRRREEERRAQDEERRRKESAAQRLKELREKEAREREQREKERRDREAKETRDREERQRREREEQERKDKETKELREKEQREREQREQRARELREKIAREAKERERLKKEQEMPTRVGSTYAFSAVGEKMSPWPNGKPPVATPPQPASPASAAKPTTTANSSTSSAQRPPAPTARSYAGTEDDAYSYRPYDRPKRPTHKKSNSDLSESSWAPSQSTARTTPPPSFRAPYSTKDPDKIVIKAVYGFLNQFAKTPSSQLISGFGSVTDGLILRITTEGLFIDDDVRGVAQREWDVKAWTLKLVETGEWKTKGLHMLRATIRDQEGKRYLFVIGEEEGWKVAVGLQRLRRGTQTRALGVTGLSALETKNTLELLGWGQ